MQHNDDKLVQLTLEGDHDAFAALVEKYQSQIHALAWRKIGDFHIASVLALSRKPDQSRTVRESKQSVISCRNA